MEESKKPIYINNDGLNETIKSDWKENNEKYVIGIDLGTTNSRIGVWINGQTVIVPNEYGKYKTPSYVSFQEKQRLIGQSAKNIMIENPENTIYDIKRMI